MEAKIIEFLTPDLSHVLARPLYACSVPAGFPSPADDYVELELDLNDYLVDNPPATFYARIGGRSMVKAGIFDGDIVVVNRALEPSDGDIVVAVLDGELTLKRLHRRAGRVILAPESDEPYPSIVIRQGQELTIWGVVTGSVRRFRR